MALKVLYPTIADQVVAEINVGDVETLTRWCIDNAIVYPDPTWDDKELRFLGWVFQDKSKVIFDDNNVPHKV